MTYRGRFHENLQVLRKHGHNVRCSHDRAAVFIDGFRLDRGVVEELNLTLLLQVVGTKTPRARARREVRA